MRISCAKCGEIVEFEKIDIESKWCEDCRNNYMAAREDEAYKFGEPPEKNEEVIAD